MWWVLFLFFKCLLGILSLEGVNLDMANRQGSDLGPVNWVACLMACGSKNVILSWLKAGSYQSDCGSGHVNPYFYFSHEFKFFFNKENNLYFLFKKSCNKLLDVKCIILNSSLILGMNSGKLINTYSIILKLYKSYHY